MRSNILTVFKKILFKSRNFIFKGYREHILSNAIFHEIERLFDKKRNKKHLL